MSVVAPEGLRRLAWPDDLDAEERYTSTLVTMSTVVSVPQQPPPDLPAELTADWEALVRHLSSDSPLHRVLGHAAELNPPEVPSQESLVLQLGEDGFTGFEIMDGGCVYIWAPDPAAVFGADTEYVVTLDSF